MSRFQRRLVVILLPLAMIFAGAGAIAYFIWWDASHCVFCRSRLDEFGRCRNPRCNLGHLTREPQPDPTS
ncbi:MAG: hypothetical protein HYS09_04325 [Chloroflexi bacterium]|nr:hypothetical protein [Chloroflexota bacterium]